MKRRGRTNRGAKCARQLRVKLLPCDGEVYVLAESGARAGKERGTRQRQLKAYWARLKQLSEQAPPREVLVKNLGAAQERAGRLATGLVAVTVTTDGTLNYRLDRDRLRAVRKREGRYLLHTKVDADDLELIWRCYLQLYFVEEAFRTLKGIWARAPSFINGPTGLKPTSSSLFSPTVCRSPCGRNSAPWSAG